MAVEPATTSHLADPDRTPLVLNGIVETRQDQPVRVIVAQRELIHTITIAEMLARHGYLVVAHTASIVEAAALAIILQPDLLVLDKDLVLVDSNDPVRRLQRTSFPLAVLETVPRVGARRVPRLAEQRRVLLKKPFSEKDLLAAARRAVDTEAQHHIAGSGGSAARRRRRSRIPVAVAERVSTVSTVSTAGTAGEPEDLSIAG